MSQMCTQSFQSQVNQKSTGGERHVEEHYIQTSLRSNLVSASWWCFFHLALNCPLQNYIETETYKIVTCSALLFLTYGTRNFIVGMNLIIIYKLLLIRQIELVLYCTLRTKHSWHQKQVLETESFTNIKRILYIFIIATGHIFIVFQNIKVPESKNNEEKCDYLVT